MQKYNKHLLRAEIYRKSIHMLGCLLPIFYHFMEKSSMIGLILILFLGSLSFDYFRLKTKILNQPFLKIFGLVPIFRENEKKSPSALSFASIGIIISLIFSTKAIFALAMLILTFADTAASIIGLTYGKIKINNKSLEGSMAFFCTACAISLLVNYIYKQNLYFLFLAFIASFVATLVELFSKNKLLNDNLTIPVAVTATMVIFS